MSFKRLPNMPDAEARPGCEAEWSPAHDHSLACCVRPGTKANVSCALGIAETAMGKERALLEVSGLVSGLAWSRDGRLRGYERVGGSEQEDEVERLAYKIPVADTGTG